MTWRTQPTDPALWWYAVGLMAWSVVGMMAVGWPISLRGPLTMLVPVLALVGIGGFYQASGRSDALARAGFAMALLVTLAIGGIPASYLAATVRAPLIDAQLARWDLAFGFDWHIWNRWLHRHAGIEHALWLVYNCHLLEVVGVTLYVALRSSATPFLRALALAAFIANIPFALLPAIGNDPHAIHVPDILAIRDGSFRHFDLLKSQGLIAFPSFHAVIAVLCSIALWPTRLRWPALAFNAVVLVATIQGGAHYLVDVLAGIALAFISASMVRLR